MRFRARILPPANVVGRAVTDQGAGIPTVWPKAARTVLPDILRYDRSKPASYPNGRMLTDDVFSARFAFLTNGKAGSTGLRPHDDLQAEFPYLGPPNA